MPRKSLALHNKIFVGLAAGAFAGVVANLFFAGSPPLDFIIKYLTEPLGQIFLRMLIMVVVPLVFASLSLGVAGLGDVGKLGRVGLKTFTYFILVTALATAIGLALVNLIRPGEGLSTEVRDRLLETYSGEASETVARARGVSFGISTFVNIVPRNPVEAIAKYPPDMLALIFFSLVLGVALTRISAARAQTIVRWLEGLGEAMVVIIDLVMRLAPYGVAALIFTTTARFGYDILKSLGLYVAVVVAGLLFLLIVVYSILLKLLARMSPLAFFRKIRTIMITAFSTSSSNATLPTTIKVTHEELGVPMEICGFVLPLGATMNMNGTALFEGVTVLFLAQVFGVDLSPTAQAVVVVLSVLTAIGAAGVPGGSIPLLVFVLQTVGVPGEGIGVVLGVDRLLDMCRTVLNVTGDVTAAAFISASEKVALKKAAS